MNKTRLSELPDAVREFVTEAVDENGLILEDDLGCPQASLMPLMQTSPKVSQSAGLPTWPGDVTSSLHRDELYGEV